MIYSPIEQGISYSRSRSVYEVMEGVDGDLLRSPLGERRRNAQRLQHHLLGAPDRGKVSRRGRGSRKSRRCQEPPSASPPGPVPLVDNVREAGFRGFVFGLDT